MDALMLEADTSDSVLVARVLDGDRTAFSTVYDRYADRLFNFARSILGDPEDAADAVGDAFIRFAERLPQLRDPARLRTWLYSIVRTECLRRLRSRSRVVLARDEQLADIPDPSTGPDEASETAALRQLVWEAAAGLGERDRTLLDLHLRHGLEGADLGDVMGVSPSHAYVMIDRLRKQMGRSLGALLIAKAGRKECRDLDSSLNNWDGTFSPLVRKRVARHVDNCVKCTARRAAMVSPLALFGGVPAFAAPASLRERVLSSVTPAQPTSIPSAWLRRGILSGTIAAGLVITSVILASQAGGGQLTVDLVDAAVKPQVISTTDPSSPETLSTTPPTLLLPPVTTGDTVDSGEQDHGDDAKRARKHDDLVTRPDDSDPVDGLKRRAVTSAFDPGQADPSGASDSDASGSDDADDDADDEDADDADDEDDADDDASDDDASDDDASDDDTSDNEKRHSESNSDDGGDATEDSDED